MSVTDAEFKQWLGQVCADNADRVINLKGAGAESVNYIYVGRPKGGRTDWGNPFDAKDHGRFGAIKKYVIWLGQLDAEARREYLKPIRAALNRNQKLACYCAPLACHAHVLAGWAMTLDWLVAETRVERSEPAIPSEPLAPASQPAALVAAATGATATVTTAGPRFSSKR